MQFREPFPLRSFLGLSLLGIGCGFVGALSGARIASTLAPPTATIPLIDIAAPSEPVVVASASTMHTTALPAPSDRIGMVITVDNTAWMVLDVDPVTTESGRAHLEETDYPQASIATAQLSPELRAWRGQQVVVDSNCTDTLHTFAVVHQLSGDPGYTEDGTGEKWTLASIEEHGNALVVAKLDHCTGSYARAASAAIPAIAYTPVDLSDDIDVERAKTKLMSSAISLEVRDDFAKQMADEKANGMDNKFSFDKVTEIDTHAAIDPRTGSKWIAVHAHAEFMCGGPQINFLGMYRVEGDHVIAYAEIKLEQLATINSLLDTDGDGIPEILGAGWVSPTSAIFNLEEGTVAATDVPFYGCPC